ncbi:type IV secretory system conjugative DNA transfer family protein, partial [Ralstonia pseudosolanacearum]|uniref:type IV secretory system conjugative DNA transfer family protein n=1 Tax=Ralstonia pseudosolanacearum TaxID=1310165 RepID=UPI003CF10432
MARALMTPDELRRMDNNDCIIFEKGLKPIKANKYWWFKKNNVVKDLNNARISHNDYKVQNRGEWRKFNPYNPYQEPKEDTSKELDITPLDDLFSEIDTTSNDINNTQNKQVYNNNENNTQIQGNNGGMHQQKQNNKSRITPINHMEQRQNNNIKTGQQTNPVNNVQPI